MKTKIVDVVLRVETEDGTILQYRMDDARGNLEVETGLAEGKPDKWGYRTFEHDPAGDRWSLSASGTGWPVRAVVESA